MADLFDQLGADGEDDAIAPPAPKAAREWSAYQLAVFRNIAEGRGHTLVRARAGSGKTSTIVESFNHVPKGRTVLMVAFNKSIATELKERAPKSVEVSTLHSYGLRAVTKAFGRVSIDARKVDGIVRRMRGEGPGTFDARVALCKLVSFAKSCLAQTKEEVAAILDAQQLDALTETEKDREAAVNDALAILAECKDPRGSIDFDDMVWLPVVCALRPWQYDRVFVDEAQDLAPVQIELTLRAVKPNGRICVVADDRQCIPAGQFVSTPGGPVKIEDVREGDEVLAAKGGEMVARRVVRKTGSLKTFAYEFDLGEHGKFQATPEHVCFAAIDDPKGAFVYLMYREDLGFRIGVSRTVGNNGFNFVIRTQQERGERLWVLDWFETYSEGAEVEAHLAYEYRIPREPFVPRNSMWNGSKEATARLFEKYGKNGAALLEARGLDFSRPNYFAKASKRGRIAVNLRIGTKDGHVVEVETGIALDEDCKRLGFESTGRGTWRTRRYFPALRSARAEAEQLAEVLGGYVVESLACTGANRRSLGVRAASINVGMLVPIVGEDGKIVSVPVLDRREVKASECFDLEIEDAGTFVVNGVVVHNCIYGFRGADENAVPNLIGRLKAHVMPLSVTYRCARAIVAEAQRIVPDIEPAPNAEQGEVHNCGEETMKNLAAPGDFILSRSNAPLVGLCLGFLREGRRASVQGRDIGASLISLVKKSQAKTVEDLTGYVQVWGARECDRLRKKEMDTQSVEDRVETFQALCEDAQSVAEVLARIEALFSDQDDSARIVLSTTHKAKGLERDRVFVLRDTYARKQTTEEMNMLYVAVTRAKKALWYVRKFPGSPEQPKKKSDLPTWADPEVTPVDPVALKSGRLS